METLFECLMITAFCAAIAVQLAKHLRTHSYAGKGELGMLLTMGVGFVIGAVSKAFAVVQWTVMLYVAGAVLSYAALLLVWSEKAKEKGDSIE